MNALPGTGVAWRTDGFWILFWLRLWWILTSGHVSSFPPRGFVGTASTSFRATAMRDIRLCSTRMHHVPSTHDAPHWQLICVWRTNPPRLRKLKRGFG